MTDGGTESIGLNNITPSVREYIRADRNYQCEECDRSDNDDVDLEIHHIVPQSDGGSHHPSNLKVLCRDCHYDVHHGTNPSKNNQSSVEPLPPHSDPTDTDHEIITVIEDEGPVGSGRIATVTGYTAQHVRGHLWKLSGEKLISQLKSGDWDMSYRVSNNEVDSGLPSTPISAKKAGRDETIRKMAVYGLSRSEIIEITGLSRTTVEIAINRARARAVADNESEDLDLELIGVQLGSLSRMIDKKLSK